MMPPTARGEAADSFSTDVWSGDSKRPHQRPRL